mmetsp:Transcript_28810/g.73462  ORF Transcript_28810/g.73462 Transcript_28810/m.73462 type:complete len:240 (-) Transcript_28810:229-948(-)
MANDAPPPLEGCGRKVAGGGRLVGKRFMTLLPPWLWLWYCLTGSEGTGADRVSAAGAAASGAAAPAGGGAPPAEDAGEPAAEGAPELAPPPERILCWRSAAATDAQCTAASNAPMPSSLRCCPLMGSLQPNVSEMSTSSGRRNSSLMRVVNSLSPSPPCFTGILCISPSKYTTMMGCTFCTSGLRASGVRLAFQSASWLLQNLQVVSSCLPACCSCQRARHLGCTLRGHLHGLMSTCSS